MLKWVRTLLAILGHRKFAAVFQSAPGYTGSGVAFTDPSHSQVSSIGILLTVADHASIAPAINYIQTAIGTISYLGVTIALKVDQLSKPELQSTYSGHYVEQVGGMNYGTISAIFPRAGGMALLSCSHVIANGGMVAPGQRIQTFAYPSSYVQLGTVIELSRAVLQPIPARMRLDAAIAQLDSTVAVVPRVVERLQDPSAGTAPVTATYRRLKRWPWRWLNVVLDHLLEARLLGDPVLKIGHTSGRTDGYISAVDVTFPTHHAGLSLMFERHLQVTPIGHGSQPAAAFSSHGDSGAMVIATETERALGLVVAGNGLTTYVSKITEIMDHYSIREI